MAVVNHSVFFDGYKEHQYITCYSYERIKRCYLRVNYTENPSYIDILRELSILLDEVTHSCIEHSIYEYYKFVKTPREWIGVNLAPISNIEWGDDRDKAYMLFNKATRPEKLVALENLNAMMAPSLTQRAAEECNIYIPFDIAILVGDFLASDAFPDEYIYYIF